MSEYIEHHGILGMHWGIRRYQNADGTLTNAGRRHLARMEKKAEKKDLKWIDKNETKLYKQAYKKSKGELNDFMKDLNKQMNMRNANGKISSSYMNAYNRKLAELMNKNIGDVEAPSGKVVQYVAKRGEVGVYTALADRGYNMKNVKNGVYGSGRIAYKKTSVETR